MSNSFLMERLATRDTMLGAGLAIRRALPNRARRMIGAWCFLDHAGPMVIQSHRELRVGPHPHTGLQTFTWMIAGEILHRDSLGFEQILRPGQVNLMTAGHGISHSEEALPITQPTTLHMAQLWIALPNALHDMPPAFEHHPTLPVISQDGFTLTLLTGEFNNQSSPVKVHTPLLGMDITSSGSANTVMNIEPHFEYGVLVLEGELHIEGETLGIGTLLYLGTGRSKLHLTAERPARALLLGGEPFKDSVLLWWNFVARSEAEIIESTNEWNAQSTRFGEVKGYEGERLIAPSTEGMHFHK